MAQTDVESGGKPGRANAFEKAEEANQSGRAFFCFEPANELEESVFVVDEFRIDHPTGERVGDFSADVRSPNDGARNREKNPNANPEGVREIAGDEIVLRIVARLEHAVEERACEDDS